MQGSESWESECIFWNTVLAHAYEAKGQIFSTLSDSRVKQPLPEFTTEGYQNLQLVKLCLSSISHYAQVAGCR